MVTLYRTCVGLVYVPPMPNWRLLFRPVVYEGRLYVAVTDGTVDRLYEHAETMPLGTWGEIHLPDPDAQIAIPLRRPGRPRLAPKPAKPKRSR